jgi:hypothetical protein
MDNPVSQIFRTAEIANEAVMLDPDADWPKEFKDWHWLGIDLNERQQAALEQAKLNYKARKTQRNQ